MADYNEAIRLDPKYALAFNGRGNLWRDKRDLDRAISDYDEAIRLDPKYAPALVNRGIARRDKNQLDSAFSDFDAAIKLDPKMHPHSSRVPTLGGLKAISTVPSPITLKRYASIRKMP